MRFPDLAIGLTACALVGGLGCSSAHQGKQGPALRTTVSEIESRTRADRRKIDDLEHELSSLKLRVAESDAHAVPSLPVEVRAPAAGGVADGAAEEYAEVVGVDENGVEIIYMGDAARRGSVQPRLPAQPSQMAQVSGARSGAPSRSPAATRPPTIDRQMEDASWEVGDRLPVTDAVGPTVGQRVQEAPQPVVSTPPPPVSPPPAVSPPPPASATPAVVEPPAARSPVHAHARRAEPRTRRPTPPSRLADAARVDEGKAIYQQHLTTLQAGDHDAAAAGFRAFLEDFPDHELADNAQYWLAESLYDRKLYREALAAFRAVLERYPHGNKVPDALLKLGFCHVALGELEQARTALARLIEMFPKSHPAALAAERLETLGE